MKRTLSLLLVLALCLAFVPLREAHAATYIITFDPNGGTGSYGPITVDSEEGYIIPHPADIGITAPAGKEFYMWDVGGTFTAPADGTKTYFGRDTTLKALWKDAGVTTYTVYFDTDFATTGVPPIAQQVVTAGQKATKPADPTREGWSFDAWCTDSARTTTFDFNTPITADITLYARWGSFVFASAYDVTNAEGSQGGTVRVNEGTYYSNLSSWVTENAHTTLTAKADDGYTFVKWVKDSATGATVSTNASFTFTFTGQVTYFAIFKCAPTITTQPANVTVNEGKKATFKVVATGAESYQWQYQKPGETTWHDAQVNATSASYSLTTKASHNGYLFRCQVTNSSGTTTSSAATLTVN